MEFKHISVLLNESVEGLCVKEKGVYADGTLGGGGHSALICKGLSQDGTLIGIDKDEEALAHAKIRLEEFRCKKLFCHDSFFNIKEILKGCGTETLDGGILDLGVSSYQLDNPDRGFSYNKDARLDMRMDKASPLDAYKVVNTYDEQRLADIIFKYGEEKFARRIAERICRERANKPIETTFELSDIIRTAFPKDKRFGDKHPSKRTFQAIRIEVNGELEGLNQAIFDFTDCLKSGGRLAVITFHSLEDRIVKEAFSELSKGCTCPKDFPVCVCGKKPVIKIITKKPLTAGEVELENNIRAHSAKLRIIEKL